MGKEFKLFTSECVSPGHPDKVCDVIADSIKDEILFNDPNARIAVECLVTTQKVVLAGEVVSTYKPNYEEIVRKTIRRLGYIHDDCGFDDQGVQIENLIHRQSMDIARGTNDEVGGAGDQGIIFGYACNETKELIPLSWLLARELTDACFNFCIATTGDYLRPDSKSQVTLKYKGNEICDINTIVLSSSHVSDDQENVRDFLRRNIIEPTLERTGFNIDTDVEKIYINPTGAFSVYGPFGDSGLTGRKLVVDQYGGHSAVGGGTMQGKDPTKVDNSAALMARYIAKNLVYRGYGEKCQVQLAYAIGVAKPVSLHIDFLGTEKVKIPENLADTVLNKVDCTPKAIIDRFSLRKPNGWSYADASAHGWFGREVFPWEALDLEI